MTAPISRYLKDFSAPKVDLARVPQKFFPDLDSTMSSDAMYAIKPPPEPVIDIEAERQSAYGRGRDHAETELNARHAAEIATLKAQAKAEMDALRQQLEVEAAEQIHRRFSEMGSVLATLLSGQTAEVLAPVLTDALADRAVLSLAATIRLSIDGGDGVKITVRGPSAMFEALKAQLDGADIVFRHVEAPDIDLSAEFGDSILMTRLSAWADTLRKVLA